MKFVAVVGPTGGGKSALAKVIARQYKGEIVSCDSVQVYRGFDIGSAKEPLSARQEIPHHLIDVANWEEDFDAARYAIDARAKIVEVNKRGHLPVVVGGTGLYFRALIGSNFHQLPTDPGLRAELNLLSGEELMLRLRASDPERAKILHPNDRVRLVRALELTVLTGKTLAEMTTNETERWTPSCLVYVNPPRSLLHAAIAARTKTMIQDGLVDEVRSLLEAGCPDVAKPMQTIGYAQVISLLQGRIPKEELEQRIIFATRQYAKRQCTWFGKLPYDLHATGQQDLERVKAAVATLGP